MASSSNAIKMGRAFVQFFVEDNAAYRQLDKFGNHFKSWGSTLQRIGAALGGAGAGILAPLIGSMKEATSRASGLQQVADRIGEGVTATSILAGGFERVGVSAEQFGGIVETLKIKIDAAADSHGYLHEYLKSMGPAARLAGMETREQLYAVAEAIQRIPRAIAQTRAAKDMGLESILPQLKKGRAGIDELFASGGAGAVSGAEGAAALEATRAMTAGWVDFKDAVRQVGMALLPTAEQIREWKAQLTDTLTKVREWVRENRGVITTVAAVGVGLVAAGVAVFGLGATVATVGSGILLTVAGVKAAFALLLSPVAAFTVGFVGMGALLVYFTAQTERGAAVIADLRDGFAGLAGRVKETFGAISMAAGAGDWSLAWQIGLTALKAEWAEFSMWFQIGWGVTKSIFVDGWRVAIAALKKLFLDLGAFVMRNTVGTARQMVERLAGVVGAVDADLGNKLRGAAAGLQSDDQINAGRDAAKRGVDDERAREQAESNAHRDAASRAAMQARNAHRADLGRLQELAKWRAEFAAMPWLTDDEGGGPARGFNGAARLGDAVKGVMGGNSASVIGRQLGYGDTIPQQQLDATRGLLTVASGNLPVMARDLNTIAQRGRVGP